MDYNYVEDLVRECKKDNKEAKEKLSLEFKPFIINLSRSIFINGYDYNDIQNEGYRILFKCVLLYNVENHRFVAYATNGIKNSLYDLLKKSKNRNCFEGYESLVLDDQLEHVLPDTDLSPEEIISIKSEYNSLYTALHKLDKLENNLIKFVFFKGHTLKEFAKKYNISYYAAMTLKKKTLHKLKNIMFKY